jgi:F/Y-rich N-terminus
MSRCSLDAFSVWVNKYSIGQVRTPKKLDQNLAFLMVEQHKYDKVKQVLQKVIEENRKIQLLVDKQEASKNLLQKEKEMLLKRLMELDDSLISSDTDREIDVDNWIMTTTKGKLGVTPASSNNIAIAGSLTLPSTPGETTTPSKSAITSVKRSIKKLKKIMPYEKTPEGDPVLPAVFGPTTLISLGTIVVKPGYHSNNYIYPIGFTTRRAYMSYIKLESTEYTCEILDGGKGQCDSRN